MRELTEIEQLLDRMARLAPDQSSISKFILEFGQCFAGQPLPPGIEKGHLKECYSNAAALALKDDADAIYAEGYAYNSELQSPFLHAWCVQGARVIDNTLRHPEDYEYLGVLIPKKILIENLRETGTYGVFAGELGPKLMENWKKIGTG